jgi:hypothetical protein
MVHPFSFDGTMRRIPYALWSLAAFFSQHLFVLATYKIRGAPLMPDGWFFVLPFRALVTNWMSDAALIFGLAWLLIAAWALAALAFRRSADANISEWIAAAAIVPVAQIAVIVFLSVAPHPLAAEVSTSPGRPRSGWVSAVPGMVVGTALTLFAVAVGSLGFGSYGFGMFFVSPFVIGAVTAYVANRDEDIGASRTNHIVAGAIALGGAGLVLTALEGLICIFMASPLAIGVAVVGGLLGRAIALARRRPGKQALSGFVFLPVVYALELLLPSAIAFDTLQTINVNAAPEAVWKSLLRMDMTGEPLALPFRLGVAYPLRGEIIGEGVGAVRHGEFSTGTAIERVTEWEPNRKLAFVVETDVPSMRELSPYRDLHTLHLLGYFRTGATSFELVPQPDGRTQIIERTSHELKLDPVLYWLPMARWMVDTNNARVLAHIKRQAELNVRMGELNRY